MDNFHTKYTLSNSLGYLLNDLEGVVNRSLERSRLGGKDYLAQTREAAQVIVNIRHDLSLSEAIYAVNYFRERATSNT